MSDRPLTPNASPKADRPFLTNLSNLALRHRAAAESVNALQRICRNPETDFPYASFCEAAVKAVQGYWARLNDINDDAPQIPKWAWRVTRRQREEGSVSYQDALHC